jgi:zinc protease
LMTSIGGLRTLWAPVDGPAHAALSFRVGWADETLPFRGITHLAEHVLLAPLGQPSFAWNGETAAQVTRFYCSGTQEQVMWFLREVVASISRPAVASLDVERGLLRASRGSRPCTTRRAGGPVVSGSLPTGSWASTASRRRT